MLILIPLMDANFGCPFFFAIYHANLYEINIIQCSFICMDNC